MTLSKSNYLTYLKHPAWLWLEKNDKSKLPEVDEDTQAIFDAGNLFEEYAEQIFPDGYRLGYKTNGEFDGKKYWALPDATRNALAREHKVIFQGRLEVDGITCIFDVLERNASGTYNLYEIKSSTKAKPEHEYDLAFQTLVLEKSGLTIENIYVVHVNTEYVRMGDVDAKEITDTTEVTSAVRSLMDVTIEEVEKAKVVMTQKVMPDPSPRFARNGAFSEWLSIYESLTGNFDTYSIYNLCAVGASKTGELEDMGVRVIQNIPEEFNLTTKQYHQVQATKNGERIINTEEIRRFMGTMQYPLYFLDYETFSGVVPPFDGLRPYQQVPFQYSLHVLESPDAELVHKEYLHIDNSLSVRPLLEQMVKDIGKEGSVIVWYQSFEKSRNTEMATLLPEFDTFLHDINDRVIDLMIPFAEGWYIDKDFFGSASIKAVLPVLVPELSYKELAVQGGNTAQRVWTETVLGGKNQKRKEEIMEDLRKYCKLDTLAMVKIWEKLNEIVGK
jgi:hypothetical protein